MRYLVLYPQGGWVDMMSRIQICHWYCVMTDRTLVVDTTKNWFGDDLTYYATLSLPRLLRLKMEKGF